MRANYVSSKETGPGTNVPTNNRATFDHYIISNIVMGASNLIKGATVQLICNNIFDKVYYSPGIRAAGGVRSPNQILQMGRNFFLKINYEF